MTYDYMVFYKTDNDMFFDNLNNSSKRAIAAQLLKTVIDVQKKKKKTGLFVQPLRIRDYIQSVYRKKQNLIL